MKKKFLAVLFIVTSIGLLGNAYAHTSEVVGNYKIEVGWDKEPPIAGMDNKITIMVTRATAEEKASTEESHHDHDEHGDEETEHGSSHEEHDEMEHDAMEHETHSEGVLYVFADGKIVIIDPHSGEIVKEITEGLETVSWADPILTPDGKHVLVNDRENAQVLVIDTHEQEIVKRIEVGPRPVHMYNPNHGDEIWTHSDAEGAFYVIDAKTLEVTDVVLAANNATIGGHGKLVYGMGLGSKYAATNTNDNGIHLIDGKTKTTYGFVQTCENGGTHGKAFSDASHHIYIECGGDSKTVIVDAGTETVVGHIDGSGQIFGLPEKDLIVIVAKRDNHLIVVDSNTDEVAATIPVQGGPDKLLFYENNGKFYGFTANTLTPDAAAIDFETMTVVKTIPAGDIDRPEGAPFLHRGGDVGGNFFFTPADGDDVVSIIDAENLELHAQVPVENPHGLIFVPLQHEAMEHEGHGKGITGLASNLDVTITLNNERTTLTMVENDDMPGLYMADFTPSATGFPAVHFFTEIDGEPIEVDFHPEKVEDGALIQTMTSDGSINVDVIATTPKQDGMMLISVAFTDDHGHLIEHVNYDLVVTQNGEQVLSETKSHTHEGKTSHSTDSLGSDEPVDIQIKILGIGLPGEESNWTGPAGETISVNVVPEFGPIAMIVLATAIISIVTLTKSKVIPRLY